MAVAVNMAKHFGVRQVAAPTAGNAGAALAAYGAAAGMEVDIFMPRDTPSSFRRECAAQGASVHLVDGLIDECARVVREGVAKHGWFDMATLKEPYRIEGKKTMGLELAEQLGWRLPGVILYPTGGGTGLIGMWKAFRELHGLGWLRSDTLPRMIAVQSDGCAPIVRAFATGQRFAEPWAAPTTSAWGIRVPAAIGDFMILDAIRESNGLAVAVPEELIEPMREHGGRLAGIAVCPETAACLVAARLLVRQGRLDPDQRAVVFNTCAAEKYQPSSSG
jgi:threonine synthase